MHPRFTLSPRVNQGTVQAHKLVRWWPLVSTHRGQEVLAGADINLQPITATPPTLENDALVGPSLRYNGNFTDPGRPYVTDTILSTHKRVGFSIWARMITAAADFGPAMAWAYTTSSNGFNFTLDADSGLFLWALSFNDATFWGDQYNRPAGSGFHHYFCFGDREVREVRTWVDAVEQSSVSSSHTATTDTGAFGAWDGTGGAGNRFADIVVEAYADMRLYAGITGDEAARLARSLYHPLTRWDLYQALRPRRVGLVRVPLQLQVDVHEYVSAVEVLG